MLEQYLRAFKDPRKINLYVKYLLKSTARVHAQPKSESPITRPTLPRPDGIPRHVYLQSLRTAAQRLSVPADTLLRLFRSGKDHIGSPKKTLSAYFLVIKGLLRRGQHGTAARLLEEILERKSDFDAAKLTIAVETLTMVNRPDAALRLLLEFVPKSGSRSSPRDQDNDADGLWRPSVHSPKPALIDTRTVNAFMISLLRIGRPDAVFYLWDHMTALFPLASVAPDSHTLSILFKAARFARKCEGALQVAIADFGLDRILPRRLALSNVQHAGDDRAAATGLGSANPAEDHPTAALNGLTRLLAPSPRRTVDGFWRGERAGAVALRVAWQVFVGNWPLLRHFTPPFRAVRRTAGEQATSPLADLFHSLSLVSARTPASPPLPPSSLSPDPGESPPTPADPDPDPGSRAYYTIVPEDAAFRALFDLLAAEERASQIPLVLTWMRYLRVQPSRDTLATALVYWGELTLEGPWVERVREWRARRAAGVPLPSEDGEGEGHAGLDAAVSAAMKGHGGGGDARGTGSKKRGRYTDEFEEYAYESEYVRMVKWMTKWVGRQNMPGREETQRALQRIRWYRDMQAFRPLRDQDVDGDWSHL
ncbi:hypothetical protein C8Q76DRAFT_700663 [Earliella scabrosa]|nr:hypothetical protein C8Q76DRAFT_700663 [Earliella scabrosa]